MKRIFSILLTLGLVLGFSLVAGPASAAATPTLNHGTFGGAPYARVDANAVAAYKGEAASISAGGYVSDTEYHTMEAVLVSFDGHATYATDRGGCIYIQTVITGLEAGDIVEVDNNYLYDDGSGYYSFWDQSAYWVEIGDYTHTAGDTILNWLIYGENAGGGEYTLVIGSGEYNLVENTDDLTTIIGDAFKLTRYVKVYRGETLSNPTTSSRGYIHSTSETTGGWSTPIVAGSLDTGDLSYVGVQDAYVDDDWAGSDNGDIVNGHIFGQDAFETVQRGIDGVASSTVHVAPGTYPAGLTIDKPLSIIGSGSSSTFVTGGIKIAGSSTWSGLLLKDLYLKGDYSGNPKDAVIDLDGAPVVSDFAIEGCVLDGEGDSDRMAFYGDNVMSGDWTWEGNEIKGFRSWFLIDNTHSVAPSGVTNALGDVVFNDNWIHDCYGSIAFRGKLGEKTNSVVVSGNTFEDYPSHALSQAWAAIEVNIATSLAMYGNSIDGVPEASWGGEGQALQIWGIDAVDIHCNNFTNCYQGIWVFGGSGGGTYGGPYAVPSGAIYNNNIEGNSDYGVAVESTATGGPLDAENNWWGDDSGPYHLTLNSGGLGNEVSDNVDFTPWIDKTVTTATSTGPASFATSEGNILGLTAVDPPVAPPVELPHGMFEFTICCLTGATATLGITFPQPIPVGYKWWKYVGGSWYSLPIGSDDGDNYITVTLRDNVLPDDEDGVPGQITDQGGPGEPGGAVGWETYPVSKARVLLPWIALLAAIMAVASLLAVRRGQTQS